VVAIVGPRQCGKSTLAEDIAIERGARHVTLDDAAPREAANADPTGFIEQSELPLFIDEFQKAPALLDAIKSRVDRERRKGNAAGLFLLTGSANVWSTLRIAESLAGRAERIQLWPLSQGEIRGRRDRLVDGLLEGEVPRVRGAETGRASISDAVITGGYPEMLARSKPQRQTRWVKSYVEMILERDARDLAKKAQQLDELPRLLEAAASRTSNLLDLGSLGQGIEMKRDSVSRYLRLLELLFLVQRAPAWSRNLGQRLIKTPKLWLPDSGLAAHLLRYSRKRFEDVDDSFAGALFENFVASELTKQATWSDHDVRLFHFRTAGGREVDIVIEDKDGSVAGIELKLGSSPNVKDFAGLTYLRDKLKKRFKAGVVIHTGPETLPFGDRLTAAPVSALWAE